MARRKTRNARPVARIPKHPAKRLTEIAVEALKAQGDRYEVADLGQPGLRLRVFPSGIKSWCYLYRGPQTRVWTRLTLGKFPDLGVKAARKAAALAASRVAERHDP